MDQGSCAQKIEMPFPRKDIRHIQDHGHTSRNSYPTLDVGFKRDWMLLVNLDAGIQSCYLVWLQPVGCKDLPAHGLRNRENPAAKPPY